MCVFIYEMVYDVSTSIGSALSCMHNGQLYHGPAEHCLRLFGRGSLNSLGTWGRKRDSDRQGEIQATDLLTDPLEFRLVDLDS